MKYLFSLIIFSVPLFFFGQDLTGTVTDQFNSAIPDVRVENLSTGLHAHTDIDGNFQLVNVKISDTLKFTKAGFIDKIRIVERLGQQLNIILEIKSITLDAVIIEKKVNALKVITDIDTQINPVTSSQEILRKVPGLFIGQHAGGGKAEQIFLRGFDIDHGTDVNITVDGLPVNMVSHAHGQGYADLHFLIPETIDQIDFGKGPYYQSKGNFNTAGYVDFQTKKNLNSNRIQLEGGQFGTSRVLGMFKLLDNNFHDAYIAAEYLTSDGPFISPQNLYRTNVLGKYSGQISNSDKIGLTFSTFSSEWDASGQIPVRAVESGEIDRFGAIDDTEGGNTSRTNFSLNYDKILNQRSSISNQVYFSEYDFELYSNFTFFLDDPVNGDQIRQKESRSIYGLNSQYNRNFSTAKFEGNWEAGISLRIDNSNNNELSKSLNRTETRERIQFGNVRERNFGSFVGATFDFEKWTINTALRLDHFNFQYNDKITDEYGQQSVSKSIVSPKLNIMYNPKPSLQLYLKTGKGFHSNDTRVVVARDGREILPAAYGFDVGSLWKPSSKVLLNLAYWYLFSEQEFVYVGDAGIVEPSGRSRRQGVDLSLRYQPQNWLFLNLDTNYSHARAIDESDGEDFIPLAADLTMIAGMNVRFDNGFFGAAHVRYINDRPANEDNSIIAEGYTVVDLNLGYEWKNFDLGIQIQNLFDTEWKETQFATESRLENEANPVEEIHFTPGSPFFIKGSIGFRF